MKEGRGRILIVRSLYNRDLQKSSVESVLNYLNNINKKFGGEEADKEAEKLIGIIENPENSEADILKIVKKMSKT